LSGRIFTPVDPCAPAGDSITIDGEAHVVTTVRQNFSTDIHLNMAGVEGVGQRTGSLYIGTGTDKLVNFQPVEPARRFRQASSSKGPTGAPTFRCL
jgi:hypothetical protein